MIWQILIGILIVLITTLIGLKIYLMISIGKCVSKRDLTGKVALVTGANTGTLVVFLSVTVI